jgi:hypothetical protein
MQPWFGSWTIERRIIVAGWLVWGGAVLAIF